MSNDTAMKVMEALDRIHCFGKHANVDKKTFEIMKKVALVKHEGALSENGTEMVKAWFKRGSDRVKLLAALKDILK